MNRKNLNLLVDALAFATFVLMTASGVLVRYVLPPGSGYRTTLWGLDRHEWGGLHFWIGALFLGTLAAHLLLHWRWLLGVVRGRNRQGSGIRAGLGLVSLAALLALAAAPFVSPIEQKDPPAEGRHSDEATHQSIRGSMSLHDVERTTGVAATALLAELNLPQDTDLDAPLGRLARTHGITLQQVRLAIERLASRE